MSCFDRGGVSSAVPGHSVSLFSRGLVALAAAVVLAFVVAPVDVGAQRPYVGGLYWLEDPGTSTPGSLWFPPRVRSTSSPGSTATSFPARLWDHHYSGMPPNDACYVGGGPPTVDPEVGPAGLQVAQYIVDWYRGTVYRPHTSTVGVGAQGLFGYFDFEARGDRAAVAADGLPQARFGNPGACAGNSLAGIFGSLVGGRWRSARTDGPSGGDCLSMSAYLLFRVNTELRCEPDLQYHDDYTVVFWDSFVRSLADGGFQSPDGVLTGFPTDYQGPTAWFRNVALTLYGIDESEASPGVQTFDPTTVYSIPAALSPTEPPRLAGYRIAHPASFETDPGAPAVVRRNPFRSTDSSGAPTSSVANLFDGRTVGGRTDCLEWNVAAPGAPAQTFLCGRSNSALTSSNFLEATGDRPLEVGPGPDSPALLARPSVGMVHPPLAPFAAPADAFWTSLDRYTFRCTSTLQIVQRPIYQDALAASNAWADRLEVLRRELATLASGTPAYLDLLAEVHIAYNNSHGWLAIYSYRWQQYVRLFNARLSAGVEVDFYAGDSFVLPDQPFQCYVAAPPGAAPLVHDVHLRAGGPPAGRGLMVDREVPIPVPVHGGADTPSYWASDYTLSHPAGFVTAETIAAATQPYPEPVNLAPTPTVSGSWVTLSCPAPQADLFAPDVEVFTDDLTGLFPPDARTPDARGTFRTYAKGEEPPYETTWNRRSSGDVVDGVLDTWEPELIRTATDYSFNARVGLRFVLPVPISVLGGLPELDRRYGGPTSATFTMISRYMGIAPGTDLGLVPGTAMRPDREFVHVHGPMLFHGAMSADRPGGCVLRTDPDPGDMSGSEFADGPHGSLQRLVCLVPRSARPLGDCPGF